MEVNSNREFYAHSYPEHPEDCSHWEPLFSDNCDALQGGHCKACNNLEPQHGHLNKVAWWAGKFAGEMFPPRSEEAEAAREWGYLAGLWHDLGKFAPEWQEYLRRKADPHRSDISGKLPHSTSGAQYADEKLAFTGVLIGYLIAGHHSGLSNGIDSTDSCLEKRLKKEVPDYLSRLQRYVVAIPAAQHRRLREAGILLPLHDESYFVLHSSAHYFEEFGLHPEPAS